MKLHIAISTKENVIYKESTIKAFAGNDFKPGENSAWHYFSVDIPEEIYQTLSPGLKNQLEHPVFTADILPFEKGDV